MFPQITFSITHLPGAHAYSSMFVDVDVLFVIISLPIDVNSQKNVSPGLQAPTAQEKNLCATRDKRYAGVVSLKKREFRTDASQFGKCFVFVIPYSSSLRTIIVKKKRGIKYSRAVL
jgi:hypothetical protein